jgi:hypothetical protein
LALRSVAGDAADMSAGSMGTLAGVSHLSNGTLASGRPAAAKPQAPVEDIELDMGVEKETLDHVRQL